MPLYLVTAGRENAWHTDTRHDSIESAATAFFATIASDPGDIAEATIYRACAPVVADLDLGDFSGQSIAYREQVLAGQAGIKRCEDPSDRFQIHQTATESEAAAIRAAAGNADSAEGL